MRFWGRLCLLQISLQQSGFRQAEGYLAAGKN